MQFGEDLLFRDLGTLDINEGFQKQILFMFGVLYLF
jgi:hypothetical protein